MLNHLMIMGRLTADPKKKTTEDGEVTFCRFSIAVDIPNKKDSAECDTNFFNCIAWRNLADIVCNWYKKGDMIILVGTLRNNVYTVNDEKRTATTIQVKEIHFSSGKKKQESELPSTSPSGLEGMIDFNADDFEELLNDENVKF